MYYVDMPSAKEIGDLNLVRSDAAVSIYLPTTPLSREVEASRINLGNLVKKALSQLEAKGKELLECVRLLDAAERPAALAELGRFVAELKQ